VRTACIHYGQQKAIDSLKFRDAHMSAQALLHSQDKNPTDSFREQQLSLTFEKTYPYKEYLKKQKEQYLKRKHKQHGNAR